MGLGVPLSKRIFIRTPRLFPSFVLRSAKRIYFRFGHVKYLGNLFYRKAASRFSKIVCTGMRVPFRTYAPLTLPGMLSTAGH